MLMMTTKGNNGIDFNDDNDGNDSHDGTFSNYGNDDNGLMTVVTVIMAKKKYHVTMINNGNII